jgi:hypothetical protein
MNKAGVLRHQRKVKHLPKRWCDISRVEWCRKTQQNQLTDPQTKSQGCVPQGHLQDVSKHQANIKNCSCEWSPKTRLVVDSVEHYCNTDAPTSKVGSVNIRQPELHQVSSESSVCASKQSSFSNDDMCLGNTHRSLTKERRCEETLLFEYQETRWNESWKMLITEDTEHPNCQKQRGW